LAFSAFAHKRCSISAATASYNSTLHSTHTYSTATAKIAPSQLISAIPTLYSKPTMPTEDKKTTKTITLKRFKPDTYRFWVSAVSATLQVHDCLDIVLGNEAKPTQQDPDVPPTPALRKSIASWENRHALAREALLNALDDRELVKVYQLSTAMEIWNRLSEEYGVVSDLKYARAETALRSLQKSPTTSMKAHIDTFTRLKEERDISAPDNIGTLSTAETNLAFLASLGEPWKLFHQALGDSAHTIKTGELFAKVLAMDDSDNKTQSSDFKPLANALNTNYKDSHYSNKKKGNRSQPYNKDLSCKYCKQQGHTIEKCYKKMWADQQWNRKKKDGRKYSNSRQDSAPNFNTNNQSSSHENSTSDSPYWKANVTRYRAFQSSLHESDPYEWIVDSTSNAHLTPYKSHLSNYEEFKTPRTIEGLGSHYILALGCGDLTLTDASGNSHKLSNVIYAPDHPTAILSLSKLIFEDGIQLHILGAEDDGDFILSLPASPFLLIGHSVDNILYVNDQPKSHLTLMSKRKSPSQGPDYWHLTLGHAFESHLQKLQHLIEIPDTTSDCLACIRAKQHKIPHKLGHLKSKVKGELIHSDLAGPGPFYSFKGWLQVCYHFP